MNEFSPQLIVIIAILLTMNIILFIRLSILSQRVDLLRTVTSAMFHALQSMNEVERNMLAIMQDIIDREDVRIQHLNKDLNDVDDAISEYVTSPD